jgi:hypothetical protein
MFNAYKNQQRRQTGSRNLTDPKTLPTIWYTYMTLVTKYKISTINSYWNSALWKKGCQPGKKGGVQTTCVYWFFFFLLKFNFVEKGVQTSSACAKNVHNIFSLFDSDINLTINNFNLCFCDSMQITTNPYMHLNYNYKTDHTYLLLFFSGAAPMNYDNPTYQLI